MKWFKHMTDAGNDEKLALLKAEFGYEGIGLYWHIIEIIASQMKPETCHTYVEYPAITWRQLTGLSTKKFAKLAEVMSDIGLFSFEDLDKTFKINCPKLLSIKDNHFQNLQATNNRVGRNRSLEVDKDIEVDKDTNVSSKRKSSNSKSKPAESEEAIQGIIDLYRSCKQSDQTRSRAKANINKLFKTYSSFDLLKAIENYTQEMISTNTEEQFRKGVGNFFGQEKMFEAYLPNNYKAPIVNKPYRRPIDPRNDTELPEY